MYGNGFYNPFMYQSGNMASDVTNIARNGLSNAMSGASSTSGFAGLKALLGKFSFSGFLNGASKTLNVVNQAIPVYYQVKPMIQNAKTMFRIMGAVKSDDKSTNLKKSGNYAVKNTVSSNVQQVKSQENTTTNTNNPTFFI